MSFPAFHGKVIAVTGAASGTGLTTAKLLADRSAILSLADHNADGLQTALSGLSGDGHLATVIDVCDSASVDKWIEKTIDAFGHLHGAVNMAGIFPIDAPVMTETDEGWDRVMNINARGVFFCIRAQLKAMKAGGSIVSASSVDGQIGYPNIGAYCASKHAVIGLVRSAAKENPHIRLNCIAPGVIDTPMMTNFATPDQMNDELSHQVQKRPGEPIEVSNVIAFLLGEKANFVTGAVWNVDGGWVC